jgi:hypothetical protein
LSLFPYTSFLAMKDYFEEAKFILKFLYFYHHGNRYQGRGIMTWKPDEGFHLEAFLDDKGKSIEKIEFGRIQVPRKNDFLSIRMRPQGYDWAIAPNIKLSSWDENDIRDNRLSVNFKRVIFCESVNSANGETVWSGTALYQTKSKLLLSDTVKTETQINDQGIGWKREESGIFYEDDSRIKLIGQMIDDKQLRLYWELPKKTWSKAESWKWIIAIQDVLSIWFGETILLLKREFFRDVQKITEIKQKAKLSDLGLLSPFGRLPFDKQDFVNLAIFLARNPSKAKVCQKIFLQLIEASNQHSQQAQELILSTILEASLRTIEGRPFTAKKDKTWNVGKGLENFFNNYLSSNEWADVRHRVMKEHCYLRDRNAHPDWLVSQSGGLSEAEQARSLDSMILLSRFYGYMILALAEFKDLQPIFPEPHQTWNAVATMTVTSTSNSENAFPDLGMLVAKMSGLDKLSKELSEANTYHEKTMILRNFHRDVR